MQTKPGCLGAAKSDSSPNPWQTFVSFAANPRGSKLKKLYLDSTSTTVGNFDCSISELLSRSMKKLLRRNWPDVMLQNHTAVSSDRNTSVKTVCCFSQRLGGQRSTKLEACWCKQHQQDIFKRIRILRSSCCIPSHINCRQNHPSFPFLCGRFLSTPRLLEALAYNTSLTFLSIAANSSSLAT